MSSKRVIYVFSFIFLCFSLLILRIFGISNNQSSSYAAKTSNTYKLVIVKSRGMIYDRNLKPLVCENKSYKVAVLPSIESRTYLNSVLSKEEFDKISINFTLGKPFCFESTKFIPDSKDVTTYITKKRYYDNPFAVHILGYCDSTLTKGVSGVEKAYDSLLSENSASLSVSFPIDAMGRALSGAEPTVYDKGYNSRGGIALTLDRQIQEITETASALLKGNGSILVTDVQTGQILSMVSLPEYNVNDIGASIASDNSALLNRNLCAYNIGSTYKIIVSAAALSHNVSPLTSHNCIGNFELDGTLFGCHKEEGHGRLNLKTAFANSCNPYFIKLGLSIGKEQLISTSSLFGLGKAITLCDGIVTASGNLPTADSIKTRGDLANISFGQGSLMATPIHIAKIISIIANGGYLVEPSLVLGKVDKNGSLIKAQKQTQKIRVLDAEIVNKIKDYMVYTVQSGTGRSATPENLGAGGKTASAETGWQINGENIVQAWFSGFYPAEKPQYAIVVLCEGGNSGAVSCAPVFKKICDGIYESGLVN